MKKTMIIPEGFYRAKFIGQAVMPDWPHQTILGFELIYPMSQACRCVGLKIVGGREGVQLVRDWRLCMSWPDLKEADFRPIQGAVADVEVVRIFEEDVNAPLMEVKAIAPTGSFLPLRMLPSHEEALAA